MFPKQAPKLHISFEDPDGKEFEAFEDCYKQIETTLLPKVKEALGI